MSVFTVELKQDYPEIEGYFQKLAEIFDLAHLFHIVEGDHTIKSGKRIHLDVFSVSKDAPTVIFIPGTGTYSLCYTPFYRYLYEAGYNVVGFDPRGHGRSEGEKGDYTLSEIMLDAEAAISYAIDRFNPEVSLMGCSQGGILAFYMAARDTRLKSVICQNFADLMGKNSHRLSRHPRATLFLKPFLMPILESFPEKSLPVESYINLRQIPLKYFGNLHNFLEKDPLALKHIKWKAIRSLASTEMDKPIHQIEVPILGLQPGADEIFPLDYIQGIYDQLTCKKQLEIFPGLGHAMLVNNPELVAPKVVDWLKEIH